MGVIKRLLSTVLMVALLLSFCASAFVASAASVYVRPKKIVYLVMDDSSSMSGPRTLDANYALQTFLAVLDKDEEVVIYFLNNKKSLGDIDIAKKSNAMLDNVRVKYPQVSGGTPFDTVEDAAEDLRKASSSDPNREYWLVVITDGEFGGGNPQNYMEKFTNTALKNGSYPKFLYVGIGGGEAFTVPKGAEDRFFLESAANIIPAMNDAVLHITGRHKVTASNASKNTIKFNLPYPARNIVVLAQTYDTKITSYKTTSALNISENYRIQYPVKNPPLQYSSVGYITEKSGSSIKGGTVELTYDTNIDASDVLVMVEPAIGIDAVFIGEGNQPINPEDMRVGEEIKVKMTICDSETKAPLENGVFGTINQYIIVNDQKFNGSEVTFKVPANELDISLVAEFSDGFVLDLSQKITDLKELRRISLFISDSGYFEADIDNLKDAPGIVVTPLLNGSNFTAEDIKNSSLKIRGGGLFSNRFEVTVDETNGTFTIHPKAGLFKVFTPTDEIDFEIVFSDGIEQPIKDTITVKITGDRPIWEFFLKIILTLLAIGLFIYILIVELTRIRFPKGSYVKYYTVTNEGAPDTELTDKIYLNRPSFEKLKNGSYNLVPYTRYKVNAKEHNIAAFSDLTYVAFDKTSIRVDGITDVVHTDDYGNEIESTSFIPTDKFGNPIAVHAPTEDDTQSKLLMVPFGNYILDDKVSYDARLSTDEYDRLAGEIVF